MVKKITAVLSALSLISAAAPVLAVEEAQVKEVIRYECTDITNKDNKKYILNSVDNDKYPLKISYASYLNNGNHVKTYKVNDTTYSSKSYVDSWYTGEWAQNIMGVNADIELKNAFEGGFTADMWFKLGEESSKYVLMNAGTGEDDAMFRVEYYKDGDGAGSGKIIITRKMNKGENEFVYGQFSCFKTFDCSKWHNISVSFDESSGINAPLLVVDGQKINTTLAALNNTDILPTKDNGYTPAPYTNLNSITYGRSKERISDTSMAGNWVNGHIYFSQMSVYDGAKTEADLLESYEKNIGFYEPEFDVKIKDGLGAEIAKSDLENIFAVTGAMPEITIDTSKVEATDTALFNAENVTITDLTDNKQLNTIGVMSDVLYNITSDEYLPGHRYMLKIEPAVTESRTKAQILEFATTASVPEIVAKYNMDKFKVNNNGTTSVYESVGNLWAVFGSTPVRVNKYDDTYYLPPVLWAPSLATSDNLKTALSDEFTLDIWFRFDPNAGKNERKIWSYAANKGNGLMLMLSQNGGKLVFTRRYSYIENDETKEALRAYYTTATNVFSNGWNHLIFAYDPKTDTKKSVVNGIERTFDSTALHWGNMQPTPLPEDAVPYINNDGASIYVNGTAQNVSWSEGGFVSPYQIGAQTYYNKAASVAYMKYLSGLDSDRYDTAYDITLLQDGKELTKNDLTALAKGNLTAQISIAETEGFNGKVYIENAQSERTVPTISWNEEGTLATLSFTGLTNGEYKLVIAKEATDSTGAAIRKTDYVLPLTVVGTTELSLLVNGVAVPQGTKVTGDAYALAELVNVDNAVLVAARYNEDGKLVSVESSDEKFGELNNQIGIYIEGIAEGETVKLMLWNSLNVMTPVIQSAEY